MFIKQYNNTYLHLWNEFVTQSKNGTFLFQREYIDYHQDRFRDASLLIFEDNAKLLALLPANKKDNVIASHEGLTYGGFVIDNKVKLPKFLDVFNAVLTHFKEQYIETFVYKTIPYIYHTNPAEEDRYALFLCNAHISRRGVLAVIDLANRLPFQERRIRGVKKALKANLSIRRCQDFSVFWSILTSTLYEAYNTRPVHSLQEIKLLSSKFPENIKLFACFEETTMISGVVIYESSTVAHVQYIASSERGKSVGALDLTFHFLLEEVYKDKRFFDFGTSDENNGYSLNTGLIDQKEGFGARIVVHDHYAIDIKEWSLDNIKRVFS